MQRITRLLTAPPSGGRWAAKAALGVLLVTGTVAAMQLGSAGNWRPELHVRSTTDGKLGPGDEREITANGVDGQRYYKASVDANGRLTETYKRNGQAQPLDAGARRWLAAIDRMSLTPPAPPKPPAPPAPPSPPSPPSPPDITDSSEFQALLGAIAADPRVGSKLGAPLVATSDGITGNLQMDAGEGEADLRIPVSGPKGRANIDVVATRIDDRWTIQSLEVE